MKMRVKEVNSHFFDLVKVKDLILPSKLSFAVSRNLGKLQREVERIEKERKRLCELYADKDKKGEPVMVKSVINGNITQQYKISGENKELFEEEYNELLDAEVDIEIHTVKREVIERCEEVERYDIPSVSQLLAMSFMTED